MDANKSMRMSGGHSLAAGLDGGNTIRGISQRKYHGIESLPVYSAKRHRVPSGVRQAKPGHNEDAEKDPMVQLSLSA